MSTIAVPTEVLQKLLHGWACARASTDAKMHRILAEHKEVEYEGAESYWDDFDLEIEIPENSVFAIDTVYKMAWGEMDYMRRARSALEEIEATAKDSGDDVFAAFVARALNEVKLPIGGKSD